MRLMYSDRAKRIAAGILGLLLLFIILFSSFYIVVEADHDCTGENCVVCVCIRLCESILRKSGGGIPVQLAAVVPVLLFLAAISSLSVALPLETLISRKVRLNN